jgi:subtilisin family serine protease
MLSLWLLCMPAPSAGAPNGSNYGSNGVVVQTRPGTDVNALARDYNARVVSSVPSANLYTLAAATVPPGYPGGYPGGGTPPPTPKPPTSGGGGGKPGTKPPLPKDPRVITSEPNQNLNVQIHVGFDGNKGPGDEVNAAAYAAMRLDEAQQIADGTGVRVAVLDTGVDPTHPDVAGHLVDGYNALNPGTEPLDVADGTNNQAVGHGTMVASLIARVAPRAEIIPVRVMNGDGSGPLVNVIDGIRYAIAQKANIINISFGTPKESGLLDNALDAAEEAGVLIVAAAGNQGSRAHHYPASSGGTIAVASVDLSLAKSPFSNYGSEIQVDAAGANIRAASTGGGYAVWSGTSVATPFVSGAAALVWSTHPRMEGEAVGERLRQTAQSVDAHNPNYVGLLGGGLIDMARAAAR